MTRPIWAIATATSFLFLAALVPGVAAVNSADDDAACTTGNTVCAQTVAFAWAYCERVTDHKVRCDSSAGGSGLGYSAIGLPGDMTWDVRLESPYVSGYEGGCERETRSGGQAWEAGSTAGRGGGFSRFLCSFSWEFGGSGCLDVFARATSFASARNAVAGVGVNLPLQVSSGSSATAYASACV